MILGLDCSHFQTALPWPQFKATGRDFAIVKVSQADWADPMATQHIAGAKAAGLQVAFYHFLDPATDGVTQARAFARLAPIDNTLMYGLPRYWCDVEVGLNLAGKLTAFLLAWKQITGLAIGIYTGLGAWANTIGAGHTEFKDYPLWNGSITLPDIWTRCVIQQNPVAGHLPGYAGLIDLDEIPISMPTYPIITRGSKVGLHSITHAQLVPLVRKYHDAGVTIALTKSVNDAGPNKEIKTISPGTITIARIINPVGEWENIQDPQSWDDAKRGRFATESVQLIFNNADPDKLANTDYWTVCNEVSRVSVKDTVLALIALCNEATRRGVKLSLPCWSQGEPEWDDMLAMADPVLNDAMRQGGHILDVHEGPTGRDPVDSGFGGGAGIGTPTVAGAGSFFFRYRYQLAAFKQRGVVAPPMVISEAYYGGPDYMGPIPDLLERVKWVDTGLRQDSQILAVTGFTVDPDATWVNEDYTPLMQSDVMLQYLVAEKDKPNGDSEMQPLFHAKALIDLAIRDSQGNPTTDPVGVPPAQPGLAGLVKAGTTLHIYAVGVTAGNFSNRATINSVTGANVWGVATALQRL